MPHLRRLLKCLDEKQLSRNSLYFVYLNNILSPKAGPEGALTHSIAPQVMKALP